MSLIHEALKKIEGTRHGYSAPTDHRARRDNPGLKRCRLIAAALLAVSFFAALAALHQYRSMKVKALDLKGAGNASNLRAAAPPASSGHAVKDSESSYSHGDKGIQLYRAGLYEDAVSEFKEALKTEPDNSTILNNLGLAYLSMERVQEARASLQKALRLRPDYPEALNNYGLLLAGMGEHSKAVGYYEKALKLKPGYADPHLNIAISLETAGGYDAAVEHYEKFLKLDTAKSMTEDVNKKIIRLRSGPLLK